MSELTYALEQNYVHDLSPVGSSGRGGDEGRARAQLEERVDDAEASKDRKGVFGAQNAAGVERNQHQRPHLETARQRVRDREALQRQRSSQASDANGEILRGRNGQGVCAGDAGKQRNAQWPRKRKGRRQVRPRPWKIVRQLGRTGRGVEIDAQHDQRRGGDRGRAVTHQRLGELTRGEIARRALKGVVGIVTAAMLHEPTAAPDSRIDLPVEVAGIKLPRSTLARTAARFSRSQFPDYLFNHCMRTFLFGAVSLQGQKRTYDADAAFAAAADCPARSQALTKIGHACDACHRDYK